MRTFCRHFHRSVSVMEINSSGSTILYLQSEIHFPQEKSLSVIDLDTTASVMYLWLWELNWLLMWQWEGLCQCYYVSWFLKGYCFVDMPSWPSLLSVFAWGAGGVVLLDLQCVIWVYDLLGVVMICHGFGLCCSSCCQTYFFLQRLASLRKHTSI